MDFYFGIDLLHHLQQYYESRLALALSKKFDQKDDKYHWLFQELMYRVTILRQLLDMTAILPELMCRQTADQIFAMIIGHTSGWFSDEVLGTQPRDREGQSVYFQESNPYWADLQTAMDRFTTDYDYTRLSTFYIDLVEYIVMAVRLYFFIREKQFRPIDRAKYDDLVGIKAVLPAPA